MVRKIGQLKVQDLKKLKVKVHKWLSKRAGKREMYGPGRVLTLEAVYGYYNEAKVTKIVADKYDSHSGDRESFLGHWRREICELVKKEVQKDKQKLAKYEAYVAQWTQHVVFESPVQSSFLSKKRRT